MGAPLLALKVTAFATWLAGCFTNEELKKLTLVLGQLDSALGTILVERELCEKKCLEDNNVTDLETAEEDDIHAVLVDELT